MEISFGRKKIQLYKNKLMKRKRGNEVVEEEKR